MIILPRLVLVTLSVTYYRLDYPSILNDFTWQVDDTAPGFPRVHGFLRHWREEVGAVIARVDLAQADGRGDWGRVDDWFQ